MAGNSFEIKIEGLDELRRTLRELPAKLQKRALRNALAAGARIVRDAARQGAPVLREARPYRTVGLVRRSIVVRTSKESRRAGDVGVFVNVRPAKAGLVKGVKQRGAKSPLDPFYWRWLEFGRQGRTAQAPRGRVGRVVRQVNGKRVVVTAAQRSRRALSAVGPMQAYRFLRNAAGRLGDALTKFQQVLGPQIQRLDTNPKDPM